MNEAEQPSSGTQPPQNPGADPRAHPVVSQQIVAEITDRLAKLQAQLLTRDDRVARIEAELHEAKARVLVEQTERSREQAAMAELAERLAASDRRLQDFSHTAQAQGQVVATRIRELQARVAALTQERDQAIAAARQLQSELAAGQTQGEREGFPKLALGADEPAEIEPTSADAGIANPPGTPSHGEGIRIRGGTFLAAAALVLSCAGLSVFTFLHRPPRYQLSAVIVGSGHRPEQLAEVAARIPLLDSAVGQFSKRIDAAGGVISLSLETNDPASGRVALDRSIAGVLAAFTPVATRPEPSPERQRLLERLGQIDRQLAGASQPAGSEMGIDSSRLVASWKQLQNERGRVREELKQVAGRLTATMPEDAGIRVDAERLRRAVEADPKLQADTAALVQREQQLADTMRVVLQAAEPRFKKLQESCAAAEKVLEGHLQGEAEADVKESLTAMKAAVADWLGASRNLAETWREKGAAIAKAGGDALTCRAALEPAAKEFMDRPGSGVTAFRKSLDAIGQGGDQPTKRLVLRNTLARDMQDVLDAHEGLVTAAKSVLLTENIELAAMVQRVAGLRVQVQGQRERLIDSLRQATLRELRQKRETELGEARAQSQQLAQKAADLDAQMMGVAAQVVQEIGQEDARRAAWVKQVGLYRDRQGAVARLNALDAAESERRAEQPVTLRALPVREIEPVAFWRERLVRAIWTGLIPLASITFLAMLAALLRNWRRSKMSMQESQRALREAVEEIVER